MRFLCILTWKNTSISISTVLKHIFGIFLENTSSYISSRCHRNSSAVLWWCTDPTPMCKQRNTAQTAAGPTSLDVVACTNHLWAATSNCWKAVSLFQSKNLCCASKNHGMSNETFNPACPLCPHSSLGREFWMMPCWAEWCPWREALELVLKNCLHIEHFCACGKSFLDYFNFVFCAAF